MLEDAPDDLLVHPIVLGHQDASARALAALSRVAVDEPRHAAVGDLGHAETFQATGTVVPLVEDFLASV